MISPVNEKTGKVAGSPVVARDITSHKQGEAVSRLSEKRVLVALKHAPVVVITQDLQLRLKWITPPSAWDYPNLLGSTEAEILGEEQGAHVTAIKQEVLRTGEGSRTEVAVTFEGVTVISTSW